MKNIRKIVSGLLGLIMLCAALAIPALAEDSSEDDGVYRIVTSVFPIYDWVRHIVGDAEGVEVSMLEDSGVDLHNFYLTTGDLALLSKADLFIYVGGKSDSWADLAISASGHEGMIYMHLLDALGSDALEEELVEGMEEEGDSSEAATSEEEVLEEGAEQDEHDHDHVTSPYEEHVWLSLRNAMFYVRHIARVLEDNIPESADIFAANAEDYLAKLEDLNERYFATVMTAQRKVMLFADRFPFRYLFNDYGIDYYAAFKGCSAETEASAETIVSLAGLVDELDLPVIMTIEGTNHNIAETVASSAKKQDVKILVVDSLQSVTADRVAAGADYLEIMEKNLEIFREALN